MPSRIDHRNRGVVHESAHPIGHGGHAEYAAQLRKTGCIRRSGGDPAGATITEALLIVRETRRGIIVWIEADAQQRDLLARNRFCQPILQPCELAALGSTRVGQRV